MGELLGKVFIEPDTLPQDGNGLVQVLFLGAVYGYILFNASGMISEGSELLLLTSARGVVGSVVLPILGAIPDGAIILFSGATQDSLAVGVGALAGSTIMLLTVPWCLAIIAGRVDIVNGHAKRLKPRCSDGVWTSQLCSTASFCNSSVSRGGWFMLLTMVTYFVIQVPSILYGCTVENCGCPPGDIECLQDIARGQSTWAIGGLILAVVLFCAYLYDQLTATDANMQDSRDRIRNDVAERAMERGLVSLKGIFNNVQHGDEKDIKALLHRFFSHYDADRSGTIDAEELSFLVKDLGGEPHLAKYIIDGDKNADGLIDFGEFERAIVSYLRGHMKIDPDVHVQGRRDSRPPTEPEKEEEEEEDEVPDDLSHLDPAAQQRAIWMRSLYMMAVGTALVLTFSDPMVGVLSAIGSRIGVSAFYISFILAPLASNASELIAAYTYALKKTEKTFTISLSTLIGAACMNNTFCLAIFLWLIYSRLLLWEFTAETIAIVVTELVLFCFSQQHMHKTWQAPLILAMLPTALGIVYVLEAMGLD
ncbi:hypothetical protein DIPPA_11205 [Diplonema papillatum]|nr:hypothetical protein DIPPA_11205 [Diplonema papillatum]